ncbi:hypothetical protein HPP92_000505 [Vanilla planifolia]|uniref:Uncharacterized protein n=1 Tax=Vanilla planifolia TaxID=51239 RepID=A0A835RQ14_VANPL|nr:hypothetical protein HPP92_000505 [Vanilla planifolia]
MLRSLEQASSLAWRMAFSAGQKLITPAMFTAISPSITKPDLAGLCSDQAFSPSEGEEADFSEGDRDSEDIELDEEDIFDDEGDDDLVSEEEENESD